MRKILYYIVIFVCFFTFRNAHSQQYNFTGFSIENGLAQSQVYAIFVDSRGYLWIGTDGGGVSIFDGINFTNITKENGLISNQIRSIFEDSQGNMWFGTKDAYLCKYDGVRFTYFNEKDGLLSPTIWAIAEDLSGNIIVGTERGGLFRMKENHFKKVSITGNDSINITVNSLYVSKEGVLWVGTKNNGIFRYDNPVFKHFTEDDGLPDERIFAIKEDKKGNIWFGTQNGVCMYNGTRFFNYTSENGLCGNHIQAIATDNEGNMWFGSNSKGASKWNGKAFTTFNENNGLCYDYIMSMVCDKNNNIWFGTDGGGICKFDGERFMHLTEKDGLVGNLVMAICEDNENNIWFGTYGNGISKYNGRDFINFDKTDGLCSNLIYRILQDKNGNMWFASKGGGVSRYDGRKFTNFNISNGLPSNLIYAVIEDSKGNLIFGTLGGGISIYNGKSFTNIGTKEGLCSDYIYSIYEDEDGNLWLGTDDEGACMIFADNNSDVMIQTKKVLENNILNITKFGLTNKMILGITADKYNNLWFGSFGGGITRFDGSNLKNFSVRDGLNSNNIYLLMVDSFGFLWVGTERGLNKLDIRNNPEVPTVETFSKQEGFIGIETNFNSIIEDHEGNIWIGNLKGATKYNPSKDIQNSNAPLAAITDVKLFFEKTDWSKFTDSLSIWGGLPLKLTLPYNQNHLTFEFIGIDQTSPLKVSYQWILKGFDKKWSPLSSKHEVTYPYLPPGEYEFQVKAYNNDGITNEEPVSFKFTIPPPFWQTMLFYVLIGAFILLMIFLFIRWRLSALEKEKRLLEEKVIQRTEELRREKAIVEQQTEELRAQTDQLALVNKELEKLSIVARETDNSVMIADKDGNIDWVNEGFTKLMGYTLHEFCEHHGDNLVKASSYPEIGTLMQICRESKKSVVYASVSTTKDNKRIWIQTTLTPIFDELDQLKQFVAIDSDITKIKEAEEQIRKHNQEIIVHRDQLKEALSKLSELESFKESLTGMIVHDMKNHLNTIISFSSQVISEMNLRTIHQAGKQMLNMVLNILDVQKFEKTEVKLSPNIHNIQTVVKNALEDVSLLVSDKGLNIKNQITGILQSNFDYDIILRVLVNIFTNAIKYTPTNGDITIFAEEIEKGDQAFIKIGIQDTGHGIPKDMLEKIFDKFAQVEAKKSGMARSTGLGLSFCKMVVEAHKGKIWAESEIGKGTTFYFTLPMIKGHHLAEEDIEEIEMAEVESDLILQDKDLQMLRNYSKALENSDIFEISENIKIIESIRHENDLSENARIWLEKLESACYNFNEHAFSTLLKEVKR